MTALILLLIPFGGAVAARLAYRRLAYRRNEISWWMAIVTSLIAFLAIRLGNYLQPVQGAMAVAVAAGLGFVAPELWKALRTFLRYFKQFQALAGLWEVVVCTVVLTWFSQTFFGITYHLVLVTLIILGIWIMLEPLFKLGNRAVS